MIHDFRDILELREGIDDLLVCPLSGWIACHVDMHYPAAREQ